MKTICFTIILLQITLFAMQAQDEKINQTDEYGRKIGKWIHYFSDGKIASINYYSMSIETEIPTFNQSFQVKKSDINKAKEILAQVNKSKRKIAHEVFFFLKEREEAYFKSGEAYTDDKLTFFLQYDMEWRGGNKIGEWQYLYPNGTLKFKEYYSNDKKDSLLFFDETGKLVAKRYAVEGYYEFLGIKKESIAPKDFQVILNTTEKISALTYYDLFHDYPNLLKKHFFGKGKMIQTNSLVYGLRGNKNEKQKITIQLTSNAEKNVTLNLTSPYPSIVTLPLNIHIPAKKTVNLEIEVVIPERFKIIPISFSSQEVHFQQFIAVSDNYLNTNDFDEWEQAVTKTEMTKISKQVYYERVGGESLLKVYEYSDKLQFKDILDAKVEELTATSIAKQQNEIDFKGWKSGTYLLRIIDFNTNTNQFKLIKLVE